MVSSISANLDTKAEFSRLNIDIVTEKESLVDSIVNLCDQTVRKLSDTYDSQLLEGYKVSRRCDEIYLSEKLHHYGFVIAPQIAITGWEAFSRLSDGIDSVTLADIKMACDKYLSQAVYIAAAVTPATEENENIYRPLALNDEEVKDYFAGLNYPDHDLGSGEDFKMPPDKDVSRSPRNTSTYLKETLDNGLTIIVKSNPDSRVMALNVIGKNRSATEPPGKDGITDFVNRLLEKGTTTRSAETLSQELSSIGANVTLHDNPWIPYDDRYTTRQYSFMKFETIDQFTEKGLDLFSDMIINPLFDTIEIEKARKFTFGQLGRNSGSPRKSARTKLYYTLFENSAYSKTIEGTYRTVNSISRDDLIEHHKKIYSPENMIITIGTNYPPEEIMAMVRERFGVMPQTGFKPIEANPPTEISKIRQGHEPMDKEQVYIYIGNLMPAVNSPDAAAIKVANAVLSTRLYKNLREQQSLAYSVGSSVTLDKKFGWFIASIGTGKENFEKARNGILAEMEKMKAAPPSENELIEAINSLWGSSLMRNLSRINQAYYMGVYEYLGVGYNYGETITGEIRSVTAEQVHDVSNKYFDTKNYVIATAGDI
jgi:predicted Zn-dependent peptidase